MRKIILMLVTTISVTGLWAKDPGISFEFPDSLKKNANVVFLTDDVVYTRNSLSNVKQEVHQVITILSDRGDDWATFRLGYDKFSTITNIEATIYDSKGEKVRKLKSSDIMDYAAFDGYSLYSDNRMKKFELLNGTYPYTIDFLYTIEYRGFISLPAWYGVSGYNAGVKESSVIVKYPTDLPIKYKEKNTEKVVKGSYDEKKYHCLSWKISNVLPLEKEKFSPDFDDQIPNVLFAANDFSFDDREGKLTDWLTLGKWISDLLINDYSLSEKTKSDLNGLKAKYSDRRELIKQVYKYMQSKTRYVGIQLGIGGLKPFSPEVVDEVGYGDCKALSYYTHALLQYVGIPSYYTVIGVSSRKIEYPDFPSISQMNHAILCIPEGKDTIWLECTSQTAPFNTLSTESKDRLALLITEEGGKLVMVPAKGENKQLNEATVKINAGNEIECSLTTKNRGSFFDEHRHKLYLSDKELKEELLNESPISDITLKTAKVGQMEEIPEVDVQKSFTTKNFVSRSGNRMFVELSPFTGISKKVAQKSVRRNMVDIEESFTFEDKIVMQLPDGGKLEFCPEGKVIESEFGSYKSTITSTNGQVVFQRILTINKNKYPKEKYASFIGFLNGAADADKCKVVITI